MIIVIIIAVFFLNKAITAFNNSNNKSPILPEGWKIIRPPHEVSAIVRQGDIIWAGGVNGVFKVRRKEAVLDKKLESDFPIAYVKAMTVDKNNVLWIGHEGGLAKYDGKTLINLTTEDGLLDNRVNALTTDKNGDVWVGTWKGAFKMSLGKINPGKWSILSVENGLKDDMVNAILCDTKGGVWFGSYVAPQGGISYLKDNKWYYFSTENGLPHNNINAFWEDNNGVWSATGFSNQGGACAFTNLEGKPAISKIMNKSDGLAGNKVRSVYQDNSQRLWFGSEYDGIAVLNDHKINVYTTKDGLSDNEVKCMLQDNDGNMWLGTRDGITYISNETRGRLPETLGRGRNGQ